LIQEVSVECIDPMSTKSPVQEPTNLMMWRINTRTKI
jgi:hypothetical protein